MKLFEIPKHSKIICDASDGSKFVWFERIDGMYSYCTTEKGTVVHLFAGTDLEKQGDNYIIK